MQDGYVLDPDPDKKVRNTVKEEAKGKDPSFYRIVEFMDGDRGLAIIRSTSRI